MDISIVEPFVKLPTARVVADYHEITEEQWHELRRGGIGGSDAGAVMGVSRYASPLTVWMQKTGRVQAFGGNEATEVGKQLEPLIRAHMLPVYLDEQGISAEIVDPSYVYAHMSYDWMRANVDGFLLIDDETVGLEIKTGGSYQLREWGGIDGDEIPDAYYAQVQHYMMTLGIQRFFVFGLIGNRRLHRWIERNQTYIDELRRKESELWELIEANDPLSAPMPIGLSVEDDALSLLGAPMIDATADLSDIDVYVDRYYSLTKEIKDLEEEKKEAQQIIKRAMGQASRGATPRYTVTRVAYTKQQFDHGRYAKDHPEAIADYMREIEIDFPRVKENK